MSSKFYLLEMSEGAAEKIVASKRPAAVKRGAAFKEAWSMAKDMTGYNETSPIWGKTRYEVFSEMEDLFIAALQAVKDKRGDKFDECNDRITLLRSELAKRSAATEVARATRKA
jgi:hypothetical protein